MKSINRFFRSFMFRRFFLFCVLSLWVFPAFSNVCLHPFEAAALFHGNSKPKSRSSKIASLEKEIKRREKTIEDIEAQQAEWLDQLENSFDDNYMSPTYDKTKAVARIKDYIEAEQDEWEEDPDSSSRMPWDVPPNNPDNYFKSNGRINATGFCKSDWIVGTSNKKKKENKENCEEALEELEEEISLHKELQELQENQKTLKRDLQRTQNRVENNLIEDDETEAGAPCWECYDEIREINKPTSAQVTGNVLSLLLGGAMSYYGYKSGKRGAQAVNDLRIRQGYDPLGTSGPAWAGATLGMPFIAHGIHGLANGNSVLGNYACSPGYAGGGSMYSPFAYPGQMAMGGAHAHGGFGMLNPYAHGAFGMLNPHAHAGFGINLNAHAGFPGFGGNFSMGGFPGAFSGGFPGAHGGFGMLNPHAQAAFGMLNPHAHGGFGINFNAHAGFPGSFSGGFPGSFGMNPQFIAQQQYQQQYATYIKFQQTQMQAQVQAQQAWLQHQQSVQQDWMQRQQVIGSLTQELYKIQQQIQMVASGGISSSSSLLGVNQTGINTGLNSGATAPTHTPAPSTSGSSSDDKNLPIVPGR